MTWIIEGVVKATGVEVTHLVEAPDMRAAMAKSTTAGILVETCEPMGSKTPPPVVYNPGDNAPRPIFEKQEAHIGTGFSYVVGTIVIIAVFMLILVAALKGAS